MNSQDIAWEIVGKDWDKADSPARLKEAFAQGASPHDKRGGLTLLGTLLEECAPGKEAIAKILVLAGANPLTTSALEQAILEEDYPIAKALLEGAIEKGMSGKWGQPPLECLLQCTPYTPTPDLVAELVDSGAQVSSNTTALHVALSNRFAFQERADSYEQEMGWETVQVLLERGHTFSQTDQAGVTAGQVLASLLDRGVKIPHAMSAVWEAFCLDTQTPQSTISRKGPRL